MIFLYTIVHPYILHLAIQIYCALLFCTNKLSIGITYDVIPILSLLPNNHFIKLFAIMCTAITFVHIHYFIKISSHSVNVVLLTIFCTFVHGVFSSTNYFIHTLLFLKRYTFQMLFYVFKKCFEGIYIYCALECSNYKTYNIIITIHHTWITQTQTQPLNYV